MTANGQPTDAGFTLVEVLVAMTLAALLALLALGSLRFATAAWQRANAAAKQVDELAQAETFLRDLIGRASPRFVTRPAGAGYVDFDGHPSGLRLIADPPRSLDRNGRLVFTLATETAGGQTSLGLSSRPELGNPAGPLSDKRNVLIGNLASVEWSYYGAKTSEAAADWHGEWRGAPTLPRLVRADITLADGKRRVEFIFRPRIDVDVSCIYDSLSQRCRGR